MSNVPASIAGAVMESGQDRSSIIAVVTPKKDFYIPRNATAAERCGRDRGRAQNYAEQQRLPWSMEETCKFASAEVVLSKI